LEPSLQLSPEAVLFDKAVLFDMDGLLLDSETLSLQCFNDEVTARGLVVTVLLCGTGKMKE